MYYRNWKGKRADSYACIEGPRPERGCGGAAIKVELLEEYVTGVALDALESRVCKKRSATPTSATRVVVSCWSASGQRGSAALIPAGIMPRGRLTGRTGWISETAPSWLLPASAGSMTGYLGQVP